MTDFTPPPVRKFDANLVWYRNGVPDSDVLPARVLNVRSKDGSILELRVEPTEQAGPAYPLRDWCRHVDDPRLKEHPDLLRREGAWDTLANYQDWLDKKETAERRAREAAEESRLASERNSYRRTDDFEAFILCEKSAHPQKPDKEILKAAVKEYPEFTTLVSTNTVADVIRRHSTSASDLVHRGSAASSTELPKGKRETVKA